MVALKRLRDGLVLRYKTIKDAIEDLFPEVGYECARKGLYRGRKEQKGYRGYAIIDEKLPSFKDHDEFEHDVNLDSKYNLSCFAKQHLPEGTIILDIKGHGISEVANIDIVDEDKSSKPVRSYRKNTHNAFEISVIHKTGEAGEVCHTTIICDGEVIVAPTETTPKTTTQKEGKPEQKPKVQDHGETYEINCKGREPIIVTKDFMRDFTKKYTINKLTINQMCIEFNLLRDEVHIIKTAFGLTKDSIPYIDDDIDEMTSDEMAEDTRIEKKRAFQRKLHEKKFEDIEREVKKLHNREWMLIETLEALKNIEPYRFDAYINSARSTPEQYPHVDSKTLVVPLADMHIGMFINNAFNKFNLDIATNRMSKLLDGVIRELQNDLYERVVILGLGDFVHGTIHDSIHKESEFGVTMQVAHTTELIAGFIRELYENTSASIEIGIVGGNHDRLHKDKNANSQDDSWHIVIREWLKSKFEFSKIKFHDEVSHNLVLIPMYGYNLAMHHGHERKTPKKIIESFINRGKPILEIHKGHFHNKKEESHGYTMEITHPSFCGIDAYAETNMYSGEPYVELRIYNNKGLVSTKKIKFDTK